ncbi:hypothetical protein [Metabacillus iocasae]|uniref:Uncharacterized protein n=1 Tax=Priestia iocasae TaxID=2291674 RepID=A0ABS2QZI6_9BACI|nr:hypothetical protein [Metabacillus iocasae]MBM7704855.1 hypothetical protein [Metabacillus iocasae]
MKKFIIGSVTFTLGFAFASFVSTSFLHSAVDEDHPRFHNVIDVAVDEDHPRFHR